MQLMPLKALQIFTFDLIEQALAFPICLLQFVVLHDDLIHSRLHLHHHLLLILVVECQLFVGILKFFVLKLEIFCLIIDFIESLFQFVYLTHVFQLLFLEPEAILME